MRLVLLGVAALLARARGGSLHVPSASLELPRYSCDPSPSTYDQHDNSYYESNLHDKAVSYSVAQADYDYLKKYKNGGHSGQYSANGDSTYHNAYNKDYSHSLVNFNIANSDASSINLDSVQQNSQLLNGAEQSQSYSSSFGLSAAPLVTKHIYFHVPPPDDNEIFVRTAPVEPPKKTYNIMFIKLPSQNSRSPEFLHVSQPTTVEEKTLIYVLVKKPDPPVVVSPPAAAVSQHEVLYVKYRGEPDGRDAGEAAGTHGLPPTLPSSSDPSLGLQSVISKGY